MSGFDASKYETMEQAYNAGAADARAEAQAEAESERDKGLTYEEIKAMSREEHIRRKDEVDRALEAGLAPAATEDEG